MKHIPVVLAALAALAAGPAAAQDRYGSRPPLTVSPDLSAPWVMQLRRAPEGAPQRQLRSSLNGVETRRAQEPRRVSRQDVRQEREERRQPILAERLERAAARQAARPQPLNQPPRSAAAPDRSVQTAALAASAPREAPKPQLDAKFLPQQVAYDGPHQPGTIVIDSREKLLYLVEEGGQARRYGVGVGKEGFGWTGSETITRKAEWPDWRPPAEMIAREKKKGRILPVHMKGGPENPLGARALYLGSTLYRIHGTNAPWTIGQNVSSGCFRMRNEDVTDLYDRVKVGAKVVVL